MMMSAGSPSPTDAGEASWPERERHPPVFRCLSPSRLLLRGRERADIPLPLLLLLHPCSLLSSRAWGWVIQAGRKGESCRRSEWGRIPASSSSSVNVQRQRMKIQTRPAGLSLLSGVHPGMANSWSGRESAEWIFLHAGGFHLHWLAPGECVHLSVRD